METARTSEAQKKAQAIDVHHKGVAKLVIQNFATLHHRLPKDKIMEDPRVKDELEEIIRLKDASAIRFKDAEVIRSKNDRDAKSKRREIDTVVWNIRKYRVYLHDLARKQEDVKVDANVLLEAERMLVELEKHTARCKERRQEVSLEDPFENMACESKVLGNETSERENDENEIGSTDNVSGREDVARAQESLDEIYKAYGTSGVDSKRGLVAEEFEIHRERVIIDTTERLQDYIDALTENSRLLGLIQHQINCILCLEAGEPENVDDVSSLRKDVEIGDGGNFEESLLKGLKHYRIFRYYYPNSESKVDAILNGKIIDASNAMAAFEVGRVDSSEDEEDGSRSGSENDNVSGRGTDQSEEHALTNRDCSCGKICSLAMARALTPEGELPTEECEKQKWYEENQKIRKEHIASLAHFLDLCTNGARAGKVVCPNILLCAKKIRDLDSGIMKELEEIDIDEALDALPDEIIDQSFVQQIIVYYTHALDSDYFFQLDEEVVRACKNLLEVVHGMCFEKEHAEEGNVTE